MSTQPRKIVDRLRSALDVSTLVELARFLDVVPSAINGAIRKRQIPDAWLYKVAYRTMTRVEWLKTGEEPMKLAEAVAETGPDYALDPDAERVAATWQATTAQQRAQLAGAVKMMKATYPDEAVALVAGLERFGRVAVIIRRLKEEKISEEKVDEIARDLVEIVLLSMGVDATPRQR